LQNKKFKKKTKIKKKTKNQKEKEYIKKKVQLHLLWIKQVQFCLLD